MRALCTLLLASSISLCLSAPTCLGLPEPFCTMVSATDGPDQAQISVTPRNQPLAQGKEHPTPAPCWSHHTTASGADGSERLSYTWRCGAGLGPETLSNLVSPEIWFLAGWQTQRAGTLALDGPHSAQPCHCLSRRPLKPQPARAVQGPQHLSACRAPGTRHFALKM